MTKSKTEPAVQVAGALLNTVAILANRVAERGGNLTEALVLIGTGETRYENSLNIIAGELAFISGAGKKIAAPEGGHLHTVQVNFDEATLWDRALNLGFSGTQLDSPVTSIGDKYPPGEGARFSGRIITLVNFGKDLSEDEVLAWAKKHKLVSASPRAIWALGRREPQLHIELGLETLSVVSLQGCYPDTVNVRHLPYGRWTGSTLRSADLRLASDIFSEFFTHYYFAFERDSSIA